MRSLPRLNFKSTTCLDYRSQALPPPQLTKWTHILSFKCRAASRRKGDARRCPSLSFRNCMHRCLIQVWPCCPLRPRYSAGTVCPTLEIYGCTVLATGRSPYHKSLKILELAGLHLQEHILYLLTDSLMKMYLIPLRDAKTEISDS